MYDLKFFIEKECKKIFLKQSNKIISSKKDQAKFKKRTGLEPEKPSSYSTKLWEIDKHFNPYYVRKNIDKITYALLKKINEQTYKPKPSIQLRIQKQGGGKRTISIFTIPDAAISRMYYELLYKKNVNIYSDCSYAYRRDTNAHYAIEKLYEKARDRYRLYLIEYDFASYFNNIDHEYLLQILQNSFNIDESELYVIKQLINYEYAEGTDNYKNKIYLKNNRGIPQGSTISLFLANAVCHDLDKKLSEANVTYARYADDSVIISDTYESANKCIQEFLHFSHISKNKINFKKSEGLSLLTTDKKAEIKHKVEFDFLGHSISPFGISIAAKSIGRVKRRISGIINKHLFLYTVKHGVKPTRISSQGTDWDLITCINEIRRYIYGGINEYDLTRMLKGQKALATIPRGLMSYYPLVTDESILKELDGWLFNVITRAQKKRHKLLKDNFPQYRVYTKAELLSGAWYNDDLDIEPYLPSFYRAWMLICRIREQASLDKFPSPIYY